MYSMFYLPHVLLSAGSGVTRQCGPLRPAHSRAAEPAASKMLVIAMKNWDLM